MKSTLQTPFLAASAVLAAGAALALAQAQAPGPTDPQIAQIVVTANQVDIDAGKMATARTHSEPVRAFAQQMVTDHTSVNASAVELVTRLHVVPEANATAQGLQEGGKANLAKLQGLSGAAFDRAYVEHEVAYHQAVIDAVDQVLIPGAHNGELKALLVKVRPAFVAHLDHARHLAAELGQAGGKSSGKSGG
jgi:putative membrane protein